jgi:hypothetical protein
MIPADDEEPVRESAECPHLHDQLDVDLLGERRQHGVDNVLAPLVLPLDQLVDGLRHGWELLVQRGGWQVVPVVRNLVDRVGHVPHLAAQVTGQRVAVVRLRDSLTARAVRGLCSVQRGATKGRLSTVGR